MSFVDEMDPNDAARYARWEERRDYRSIALLLFRPVNSRDPWRREEPGAYEARYGRCHGQTELGGRYCSRACWRMVGRRDGSGDGPPVWLAIYGLRTAPEPTAAWAGDEMAPYADGVWRRCAPDGSPVAAEYLTDPPRGYTWVWAAPLGGDHGSNLRACE